MIYYYTFFFNLIFLKNLILKIQINFLAQSCQSMCLKCKIKNKNSIDSFNQIFIDDIKYLRFFSNKKIYFIFLKVFFLSIVFFLFKPLCAIKNQGEKNFSFIYYSFNHQHISPSYFIECFFFKINLHEVITKNIKNCSSLFKSKFFF